MAETFGLPSGCFTKLATLLQHCEKNLYLDMPGPGFDGADDFLVVERMRDCVLDGSLRSLPAADGTATDGLVECLATWVTEDDDDALQWFLEGHDLEDFGLGFGGVSSEVDDSDGAEAKEDLSVAPVLIDWNAWLQEEDDGLYVYGGLSEDEGNDDDDGQGVDADASGPSNRFACEFCGKDYATPKILRRHQLHGTKACANNPHLKDPKHECPGCDLKFSRNELLQKHRKRSQH